MMSNWRSWFRREGDGIDEEIRAHLQMAVDERVARGESRADAELAARKEFGNVTHVSEVAREMHRGGWQTTDRVTQALVHAVRRLRRSPGYSVPVIVSLALGVGLNAAVFAVMDHMLRRPLPFADGERLFAIGRLAVKGPAAALASAHLDWGTYEPDLNAWLGGAETLESFGLYSTRASTIAGNDAAEQVEGAMATAGFASLLGVSPALGRWYGADELGTNVVVVSHSLWQRRLGGDKAALGRVLQIDGTPKIVVGVMPPNAGLPVQAEFWLPMSATGGELVVRSKPGVSAGQVAAELQSRSQGAASLLKAGYSLKTVAMPLRDRLLGSAKPPVRLLFGGTLLLLLIACANVANLSLTRTLERRRELAVRLALGANRRSLAGLIVVENVLLAVVGAVLGVAVAWWATGVVRAFGPEEIVRLPGFGIGASTLLFAGAIAIGAALLVSIAPVIAMSDRTVQPLLGQTGLPVMRGVPSPGMRRLLVAVQIATALLLITGSGLLLRSVRRLTRPDHLGFSPKGIVIVSLGLWGPTWREKGRSEAFVTELTRRVRALPGVESVALGPPPLVAGRGEAGYREGFSMLLQFRDPANRDAPMPTYWVKHVNYEYLQVYGLRLRAGRPFGAADGAGAQRVAILSATAAKLLFPDRDPINQELRIPNLTRDTGPPPIVIGVLDDVLQRDVTLDAKPEILLPIEQQSSSGAFQQTLAVYTTAAPEALIGSVRQVMRAMDPNLAARRLQTMQSVVDASLRRHSFLVRLLSASAALGLALSLIGLYAVVSYLVTQRTREIGVRMALGAQRADVTRMMLREGAILVGIGIAVGIPASVGFARLLSGFLFEVKPTDAPTLLTAALSLALVALLAAWFPARRAAGIDPASTLREG